MTEGPLCDKPDCLDVATSMLAIRFGEHLGLGYWTCELHQAEAFWQVTKVGLQQDQEFMVVMLRPDQVEDLKISRA